MPVQDKPLEAYLDPALQGNDRQTFLNVLSLLEPNTRGNVTFVTQEGGMYASSERARQAGSLLKPLGNDLFEMPSGLVKAFPASGDAPDKEFLMAAGTPFGPQDDCYKNGKGEKSGPMRRITHAQGTKTARVNWMKVKVRLPNASEAEGFVQRVQDGPNLVPIANGPFIYAGGWGARNGTAVDAGFQMSTGNASNPPQGNWSLFLKAAPLVYLDSDANARGQVSHPFRFPGGSTVELTFFNLTDLLVVAAKEVGSAQARVIVLRLNNNSRWSGDGVGNWYKMMVTIGQGRIGQQGQQLQKLDAVGFLKNAALSNAEIGYIAFPTDDLIHSSTQPGWSRKFEPNQFTIEPQPSQDNTDQREPFMKSGEYTSCEFPDDRSADDVNISGNNNLRYPKVVQTAAANGVERTSIDMRAPTNLEVGEDGTPNAEPGWLPAAPGQQDPALPTPTQDVTITVKGKAGQKAKRKQLFFQNFGNLNSILEMRVYPIGQVGNDSKLSDALSRKGQDGLVLWGNDPGDPSKLAIVPAVSQVKNKPKDSPWSDALYAARGSVLLKRPDNADMKTGKSVESLDIDATCPANPDPKGYPVSFPVIYTTGLSDDGTNPKTPVSQKYSPNDDEPEKRVFWVNLKLECETSTPAQPRASVQPPVISLTAKINETTSDSFDLINASTATAALTFTPPGSLPVLDTAVTNVRAGSRVAATSNAALGLLEFSPRSTTSIAPGTSRTFDVTATCPAVASPAGQPYARNVVILHNDPSTTPPSQSVVQILLTCEEDIVPAPVFSNPVVNVPSSLRVRNNTSGRIDFTNAGDADLTYSLIGVPSWAFTPPFGNSGSVYPSDMGSVSFGFACPATPTTLSGNVTIQTNDPKLPVASIPVNVDCVAQPPKLGNLSVPSLKADAPADAIGNLTFTNVGDEPLTFSALALGTNVSITSGTQGTLAWNQSATIKLSAKCPLDGTRTVYVTLQTNDPSFGTQGTQTVPVTVTCTGEAKMVVGNNVFAYRIKVGTQQKNQVSVNNPGTADLKLTLHDNTPVGGPQFKFDQTTVIVPAGGSTSVGFTVECPTSWGKQGTTGNMVGTNLDGSKGVSSLLVYVNLECTDLVQTTILLGYQNNKGLFSDGLIVSVVIGPIPNVGYFTSVQGVSVIRDVRQEELSADQIAAMKAAFTLRSDVKMVSTFLTRDVSGCGGINVGDSPYVNFQALCGVLEYEAPLP